MLCLPTSSGQVRIGQRTNQTPESNSTKSTISNHHVSAFKSFNASLSFTKSPCFLPSTDQILCSVDPKQIPRLSPCDDDIYAKFRERFPDLKVGSLKEADLKSEGAKKAWREFCEGFKHVDDYSFAQLLRLDAEKDYSEENSIIATKIQFYAVELARNREVVVQE